MTRSARDRLLEAAAQLFYDQGITGTGVEAVVRSAGVSKPTLYAQFDSKVDLVRAVLQRRHEDRAAELEGWLTGLPPAERPLGVFRWLEDFYADRGERGCGFLNAAAELSDPQDPGLAVVRQEKTWLLDLLTGVCRDAGLAQPESLGSQLLLLIDGVAGRVLVGGQPAAAEAVADARRAASVLLAAGAR